MKCKNKVFVLIARGNGRKTLYLPSKQPKMLKLIVLIVISFFLRINPSATHCTNRYNAIPMDGTEKYKVYCEIKYMPYQRIAIVNIGSTIDAIRDKDGKPKEFISIMEAINYMAKLGWEIAEIYGIPNGNDKTTYYFLSKEVANEAEITKGLNLNPLDKTFYNQLK